MHPTQALLLSAALFAGPASAKDEGPRSDVEGSADHGLIQRFTGSLLIGHGRDEWAARLLPDASGVAKNPDRWARPLTLEGKVTRLMYLAPRGKSPLEVFRNYQQALLAAGFKTRWTCESEAQGCASAYSALDKYERTKGMSWTQGHLMGVASGWEGKQWNLRPAISHEEGRMLVGSIRQGGAPLELLLYTSVAENAYTQRAATYIEIIEPRPMQTGQVTVDAKALGQGLQGEGRVALYGLQFDTGRTDIKPDSKGQLDEMAALLKAQPGLKVFIVGHTDNVGALDANLALSQGRAQAVVAALGQRGIAASRLQARGVANLAPLASNADEAGRARNRRVELVLQ